MYSYRSFHFWLRYSDKTNKGLTLIELLVVIVIIGILAAISLPVMFNMAAKARQSEAKTTLSVLNRGQQAYYAERSSFSPDILNLGIITDPTTNNFTYDDNGPITNYRTGAAYVAIPGDPATVKDYSAAVTSLASVTAPLIICEEEDASVLGPFNPALNIGATALDCPLAVSYTHLRAHETR
ncbi:prepilin-type N-terminal cleavage/methylation domain-containing protein, partial [Synechococcus moorigangaii CMS01]|nr:prepilin-type N-terminal cleavage/methylation domain-containing protein [Synechococcus moorigangaii CMS01]